MIDKLKIYIFTIFALCLVGVFFKRELVYYSDRIFWSGPTLENQVVGLGGVIIKIDTSIFHPATAVFNPSLIKFKNKKFMTFRVHGHKKGVKKLFAETYFAEVDEDYKILWVKPLLKINEDITHEDARLFIYKNELYSSFVTDVSYKNNGRHLYKHRQEFGKIEDDFQIHTTFIPNIATNKLKDATEKNWLFFEKNGRQIVINWLDPLSAWEFKGADFENPIIFQKKTQKIKDWTFGEIRASTAPLYIKEIDKYLCFFHSFEMGRLGTRKYYLGALIFDDEFNITEYTKEPLLSASPEVKPYIKHYTVLPYGQLYENETIHLSMGINDRESWIIKVPLSRILSKMVGFNN